MRVLIIDDEPGVCRYITRVLGGRGIECCSGASYEEGMKELEQCVFDLILLDVGLPGRSGWEVLEDLRETGNDTPVIFLTAHHSLQERVKGLNLGADDYVRKPFEADELIARVEAVIRRRNSLPVLQIGRLRIDLARRTVGCGDDRIEVSPREFEVLAELIQADGRVVSKQELLRKVWGLEVDPQTKVVEVQVARLRRKLEPHAPGLIQTVIGEGYRIVPTNEREMPGAPPRIGSA